MKNRLVRMVSAAAFGFLAVTASSMAHANLVVNGSFEDSAFTANGNFELGLIGNDVPGWFIPAGNGTYPWGVQDGAFGAFTPYGTQWVVLGLWSTGVGYSIQQTLNGLVAGTTYNLSFAIASEGDCCANVQVSYLGDSSTAPQVFQAPNSGQWWTQWLEIQTSFLATGTSVTLEFLQFNPSAQGLDLGLDNVSVEASNGVPEPATLTLLGIALAGLGFSRRRKLH